MDGKNYCLANANLFTKNSEETVKEKIPSSTEKRIVHNEKSHKGKTTFSLVLNKNIYSLSDFDSLQKSLKTTTLDNPLVLEQQYEILEHHKIELEKKKNLQKTSITLENSTNRPDAHNSNLMSPFSEKKAISQSNITNNRNGIYNHSESLPSLSPVSSSYSELWRVEGILLNRNLKPVNNKSTFHEHTGDEVNLNMDFHRNICSKYKKSQCCDINEKSLAYESIYEPINTQPYLESLSDDFLTLSHIKSVNIYNNEIFKGSEITNLYSKDAHSSLVAIKREPQNLLNFPISVKEKAVDNFLSVLQSKNNKSNHTYGLCFKCNKTVFGRNSGCTAMNQIYHVTCFICHKCEASLQGKPFYAVDGEAYCENDYWETLEKCSVCKRPVLERILRATGKPYHPHCFSCVVCEKNLDGIPFTVDAVNQIYCIEDFHRKFAPRCYVCRKPITQSDDGETVRVVALDRSFHFECYKCEDCGLLLSSEVDGLGCYPLDDHILCKECNAKRVQILTCKIQQ